jgi:hypothetical protein
MMGHDGSSQLGWGGGLAQPDLQQPSPNVALFVSLLLY